MISSDDMRDIASMPAIARFANGPGAREHEAGPRRIGTPRFYDAVRSNQKLERRAL